MHPLLKNFVGALIGVILYELLILVADTGEFDFATAAIEVVAIALAVAVVMTLFDAWRTRSNTR